MSEISFKHDEVSRSYMMYVPDNVSLDNENDLVIGLHGYTGTASGFEKKLQVVLISLPINMDLLSYIHKEHSSMQIYSDTHLYLHGMI